MMDVKLVLKFSEEITKMFGSDGVERLMDRNLAIGYEKAVQSSFYNHILVDFHEDKDATYRQILPAGPGEKANIHYSRDFKSVRMTIDSIKGIGINFSIGESGKLETPVITDDHGSEIEIPKKSVESFACASASLQGTLYHYAEVGFQNIKSIALLVEMSRDRRKAKYNPDEAENKKLNAEFEKFKFMIPRINLLKLFDVLEENNQTNPDFKLDAKALAWILNFQARTPDELIKLWDGKYYYQIFDLLILMDKPVESIVD